MQCSFSTKLVVSIVLIQIAAFIHTPPTIASAAVPYELLLYALRAPHFTLHDQATFLSSKPHVAYSISAQPHSLALYITTYTTHCISSCIMLFELRYWVYIAHTLTHTRLTAAQLDFCTFAIVANAYVLQPDTT